MGEEERWLPVVGYEGDYEVSSKGRVKSHIRGRILRGGLHDAGYRKYYLRGGEVKYGHELVLEAFVGPRPEGHHCCHSDGNPGNNSLENLRWDTVSNNRYDTVRHGRHHNAIKDRCKRGHMLAPWNNTSNAEKIGSRKCLACDRASSYVRYHTELRPFFKSVADSYYKKIVEEAQVG